MNRRQIILAWFAATGCYAIGLAIAIPNDRIFYKDMNGHTGLVGMLSLPSIAMTVVWALISGFGLVAAGLWRSHEHRCKWLLYVTLACGAMMSVAVLAAMILLLALQDAGQAGEFGVGEAIFILLGEMIAVVVFATMYCLAIILALLPLKPVNFESPTP